MNCCQWKAKCNSIGHRDYAIAALWILNVQGFYQISFCNIYILSYAMRNTRPSMITGVLTSISGGFMRNPIGTCNLNILPILKSEASNTDHWMPLTPLMLDLTP